MRLYQPRFSDRTKEMAAPFLVEADNETIAMMQANSFYKTLDPEIQSYILPLGGSPVACTSVIELKSNRFGVVFPA